MTRQNLIVPFEGRRPDDNPDQKSFFFQLFRKGRQLRGRVGFEPNVRCQEIKELVQWQIADPGRGSRSLMEQLFIGVIPSFKL